MHTSHPLASKSFLKYSRSALEIPRLKSAMSLKYLLHFWQLKNVMLFRTVRQKA